MKEELIWSRETMGDYFIKNFFISEANFSYFRTEVYDKDLNLIDSWNSDCFASVKENIITYFSDKIKESKNEK